jgi:hypothetical protein
MESVALAPAQPTARTMSQSKLRPTSVDSPRGQVMSFETRSEKPQMPAGFTLRVKPDRRRVQLPIPPGLDRRRPR